MKPTQTEQNAVAILKLLITHQKAGDGLDWRLDSICAWLSMEKYAASEAVKWLIKHNAVDKAGSQYFLRDEGRVIFVAAVDNPNMATGALAWKDEALTGITTAGNRSKIERGALPLPQRFYSTPRDVGDLMGDALALHRVAAELGLPIQTARREIQDGKIHVCPGWDGNKHVGRFHRHNSSRHQWRTMCITCRKRVRKTCAQT